jgi:hypothetical protein
MTVSVDKLRGLFDVDTLTGTIKWKRRHTNSIPASLEAGYLNEKGYISIEVDGKQMSAHRIIWAVHHGSHPTGQIDHINGNRSDNRIGNLRDVTPLENQRNSALDKRNRTGTHGVRWRDDRGAYEVSIRNGGKLIHLGRFADLSVAVAVRKAAEKTAGYHPNHGRSA